jgi:hypothetical protein
LEEQAPRRLRRVARFAAQKETHDSRCDAWLPTFPELPVTVKQKDIVKVIIAHPQSKGKMLHRA